MAESVGHSCYDAVGSAVRCRVARHRGEHSVTQGSEVQHKVVQYSAVQCGAVQCSSACGMALQSAQVGKVGEGGGNSAVEVVVLQVAANRKERGVRRSGRARESEREGGGCRE